MIVRELLTKWGVKVDDRQLKALDRKIGVVKKRFDEAGASAIAFGKKSSLFVTTPILAIGAASIKTAADMETLQTQFEVLIGNEERAAATLKDIQEFSAQTPFQFQDLAKAGRQLLGFQFGADEIPDLLQKIGDVAAASGKPIGDISLIFGQVRAAGKLTGERLLQLQERAVPIGPALAKTMGVAETAVKDLVTQGKIDFATFQRAFNSLSEEGGAAFGGMEKLSRTFSGRLSTLRDNVSLLANDIGQELLPAAKSLLDFLLKIVKGLRALSPTVRRVIIVAGALLAVIGPLSIGIGLIQKASVLAAGGMKILASGFSLAAAKAVLFQLALLAIPAALFLIADDFAAFTEGRKSVFGAMILALDELSKQFEGKFFTIKSAIFGLLFPIRAVINGVQALGGALGALSVGDFSGAIDAIKEGFNDTLGVDNNLDDLASFIGIDKQDRPTARTPATAQASLASRASGVGAQVTVNTAVNVPAGTPPELVGDAVERGIRQSMDRTLRQASEVLRPQVSN